MPYNDLSEYPRGFFSTIALTNVVQDIFDAIEGWVAWAQITGGAALETIQWRTSAGANRFQTLVPIGATIKLGGFYVDSGGLEILTASAAGDVGVTLAYNTTKPQSNL